MSSLTVKQKLIIKKTIYDRGVFAYPTEAVFGLGCDPWDEEAVSTLLQLKGRPVSKGLILIASNINQLSPILDPLDEQDRATVLADWPGPVTWTLPNNGFVPDFITGGRDTVAVRVTAHTIASNIAEFLGAAIVSTSANPTGMPPAKSALKCRQYFGNDFPIISGALGSLCRPTPVRDLRSGVLLRQ